MINTPAFIMLLTCTSAHPYCKHCPSHSFSTVENSCSIFTNANQHPLSNHFINHLHLPSITHALQRTLFQHIIHHSANCQYISELPNLPLMQTFIFDNAGGDDPQIPISTLVMHDLQQQQVPPPNPSSSSEPLIHTACIMGHRGGVSNISHISSQASNNILHTGIMDHGGLVGFERCKSFGKGCQCICNRKCFM